MEDKFIKLDFGELIDRLSILQIKEFLLDESFSETISDLEHDINIVYKEYNIKLTPNLIRQIILISQANLHIWMLKDNMKKEIEEERDDYKYNSMLKISQDFNNCIKNSIKNMLLDKMDVASDPKLKATFFDPEGWYSLIIKNMKINDEI